MPRAVLTGGPGAGKTSLLVALEQRGVRTYSESAREVIIERKNQGLPPRPSPLEFAFEILRRDSAKYRAARTEEWAVYDRGALEALGAVHALAPFPEHALLSQLSLFKVEKVFILPPWPEIYTTDTERDQSAEEASHVHELVARWYHQIGYSLIEVPRAGVHERVAFVLHALSAA
jgi:predicted ATPase